MTVDCSYSMKTSPPPPSTSAGRGSARHHTAFQAAPDSPVQPHSILPAPSRRNASSAQIACASDQGPRENLEDAAGAISVMDRLNADGEVTVLVVCDGVGGNCYGEVASHLAVTTILPYLAAVFSVPPVGRREANRSPDAILGIVADSLALASQAIVQRVSQEPQLKGMSTTAVCALVVDGMLYVSWAGDSRCYLYHNQMLRLITHDHSAVQALVEAGLVQPQDAKAHPLAHTITRFLGQAEGIEADTTVCRLAQGDVILLCTDGLSDVVSDAEIGAQIRACRNELLSIEDLPRRLVRQALGGGTTDNVTVLCADCASGDHNLTLTDGYPTALAITLHSLNKEKSRV